MTPPEEQITDFQFDEFIRNLHKAAALVRSSSVTTC